jgi:Zn-dependent M28 family amino/carboxypeptidase
MAFLTLQKSGFDPGSVHVGFLVAKVALGQVSLQALRISRQYHSTNAQIL